MRFFACGAAALLCTTSLANAAGLDSSGQLVDPLFKPGTYAEMYFGTVNPDHAGTITHPALGTMDSGDMTPEYKEFAAALKWDLSPRVSMALIYDQPYGSKVVYEAGTGYLLEGTEAHFRSFGVTALGRYKFNDNYSVHGGLHYTSVNNSVALPAFNYSLVGSDSSGTGFVLGGAYERPEIALRAALTYRSEIELDQDVLEDDGSGLAQGTMSYTLPQSVNIDLQTGVAEDTLVFANIRWVDWTALVIDPPKYPDSDPLLDYDDDGWTYTLGVARQFTKAFSGLVAVSYEPKVGGYATDLAPSDGVIGLIVGGEYKMTDHVALSGGVLLQNRGDGATFISPSPAPGTGPIEGKFDDNTLTAFGMKVSYTF